jgi:hypothetical protein
MSMTDSPEGLAWVRGIFSYRILTDLLVDGWRYVKNAESSTYMYDLGYIFHVASIHCSIAASFAGKNRSKERDRP